MATQRDLKNETQKMKLITNGNNQEKSYCSDKFKKLRNKTGLLIKKSIKNKTLKTFSKSVGDSRQTYKLANNLGAKSTLSQYNTNSSHEKAKGDQKRCCQFFQQILYRNRENVIDRIPHHPLKPAESQIQSMYLLDTDENEVIEIRNSLDKKNII